MESNPGYMMQEKYLVGIELLAMACGMFVVSEGAFFFPAGVSRRTWRVTARHKEFSCYSKM